MLNSKTNKFSVLRYIFLLGCILFYAASGSCQLEPHSGFKIYSKDSTADVRISPRIRLMYTGTAEEGQDFQSDASVPLARVAFIGTAFSKWKFFIQSIFAAHEIQTSGNDLEGIGAKGMLDGRVEYLFNKNTSLSFGQEFIPGNWEGTNGLIFTTFTNRSIVSRAFWLNRDIGVQLKHNDHFGGIPYRLVLSIAKGEGKNVLSSNLGGWMYTGRLSVAILGKPEGNYTNMYSDISRSESSRLWVSVAYSNNRNAVRSSGNMGKLIKDIDGTFLHSHLSKFYLDLSYKYNGLGLLYGFAFQRSSDLSEIFNNGNGNVFQASYLMENGIEFAAQVALIDNRRFSPLVDRDQLSFGLNKYFRNQSLKWQNELNFDLGTNNQVTIRSLLQLIL